MVATGNTGRIMKEILVRDLYVQDSSFLQQGLNEILEALYESYMVVDLVSVMPGFSDKTSVKGKHYISVWKVRPCTKNKEVSNGNFDSEHDSREA